jgi:hypothetical protein
MSATSFDVHIRALECPRCGAPVEGEIQGGRASCGYCGAAVELATRAPDKRAGAPRSLGDEVARLSRLKAQLENPVEGHAYDLARAGVEAAGTSLRDAWARAKLAPPATPEAGRLLCWIALKLADAERDAGSPKRARAALETALDRLVDDGHKHLVRCRLAIEAAREGDLASAEGWLAECDAAPELLELDGPYREALARVRLGHGDPAGVLTVLGAREGDVPFHPSLGTARIPLRLEALERLGRDDDADAELASAISRHSEDEVLANLSVKRFAPRARLRHLAARRAALPRGYLAATAGPLAALPVLALVAAIGALIPRCTFDVDPFFGVQGHLLCPAKCVDCRGPLRVVTVWHDQGDGYSTNGPQYFCPSPKNGLDRLRSRELASRVHELRAYELGHSPQATTYLFLLGLGVPWALWRGAGRTASARTARAGFDAQIGAIVAETGVPAPAERPAASGGFLRALLVFCGAALLALLVIAVDLAF